MNPGLIARLSDIGYRYGSHQALEGVDLSLAGGKVTALPGPNGAGKSTLIHLLLGLLPVQRLHLAEGTVRNYLSEAIGKLDADNRIEAFRVARDQGWL